MGWFPKTYVEYVDVEAEKKRLQEGEGVRGACVIVGGLRGSMCDLGGCEGACVIWENVRGHV